MHLAMNLYVSCSILLAISTPREAAGHLNMGQGGLCSMLSAQPGLAPRRPCVCPDRLRAVRLSCMSRCRAAFLVADFDFS